MSRSHSLPEGIAPCLVPEIFGFLSPRQLAANILSKGEILVVIFPTRVEVCGVGEKGRRNGECIADSVNLWWQVALSMAASRIFAIRDSLRSATSIMDLLPREAAEDLPGLLSGLLRYPHSKHADYQKKDDRYP